jgi:hypothetical protein
MAWLDLEAEIAEEFGELARAELESEAARRWEARHAVMAEAARAAERARTLSKYYRCRQDPVRWARAIERARETRRRAKQDPERLARIQEGKRQYRLRRQQDPVWLENRRAKQRERDRQRSAAKTPARPLDAKCQRCGSQFTRRRRHIEQVYCSRSCQQKAQIDRIKGDAALLERLRRIKRDSARRRRKEKKGDQKP